MPSHKTGTREDGLWGMYQWLDRAPLGRNEARTDDDPLNFFRRHDEYGGQ